MEPLWSPAVTTGSNRWQMGGRPERLKQAKTVAVGCDRLPEPFHGKEGVDDGLQMERVKAEIWYRNWYRSERTSPYPEGLKRAQTPLQSSNGP